MGLSVNLGGRGRDEREAEELGWLIGGVEPQWHGGEESRAAGCGV